MLSFLMSCWRTSGKFKFGVIVLAFFIVTALIAPLIYRPIIGDESPARPGGFARWLPTESQKSSGHGWPRPRSPDGLPGGSADDAVHRLPGRYHCFGCGHYGRVPVGLQGGLD